MDDDIVIRAQALGKKYLIGHRSAERVPTLRDAVARGIGSVGRTARNMLRGNALVAGDRIEEFWALKDVDFEVRRGEVVGIIGRNGAGKSTLLKVLSRITEPSEGRVEIRGRVASLLEVGTGFHPELTGRENIFLNGAILGMTRGEVKRKFDEIVDFAGVERFLDTPVKRYSSGMYVRLAFAVAAHLEPEILIVDEVLAVGDAEFQKKCLGKMQDVAGHGRTVLFVSHHLSSIRQLCQRGIYLHGGRVAFAGSATDTLDSYTNNGDGLGTRWAWPNKASAPGGPAFRLRALEVSGALSQGPEFRPDEPITIRICYDQDEVVPGMRINMRLLAHNGEVAFVTTDQPVRSRVFIPGRYESSCVIPGGLLNRTTYIVAVSARIPNQQAFLPIFEVGSFRIDGVGNESETETLPQWPGAVCPKLEWHLRSLDDVPLEGP